MIATTRSTPASLWVVGTLALAWNLLGVAAFAMELTMSAEALQALSPERQAINEATLGLVLHVLAGYLATPLWSLTGPSSLVFPVLLLVVAFLLWLFARRMATRGVLR